MNVNPQRHSVVGQETLVAKRRNLHLQHLKAFFPRDETQFQIGGATARFHCFLVKDKIALFQKCRQRLVGGSISQALQHRHFNTHAVPGKSRFRMAYILDQSVGASQRIPHSTNQQFNSTEDGKSTWARVPAHCLLAIGQQNHSTHRISRKTGARLLQKIIQISTMIERIDNDRIIRAEFQQFTQTVATQEPHINIQPLDVQGRIHLRRDTQGGVPAGGLRRTRFQIHAGRIFQQKNQLARHIFFKNA